MSQCFFRVTPLSELEREMMLVPGFDDRKENTVTDCTLYNRRSRKQPCRLTQCNCINDRIASGKLSLDDLAWGRLEGDHSITVHGIEWYDHAEERGGRAVSFVQKYYGVSYPEAVILLQGGEQGAVYPTAQPKTEQPAKPFELPPVNRDMRRAYF